LRASQIFFGHLRWFEPAKRKKRRRHFRNAV